MSRRRANRNKRPQRNIPNRPANSPTAQLTAGQLSGRTKAIYIVVVVLIVGLVGAGGLIAVLGDSGANEPDQVSATASSTGTVRPATGTAAPGATQPGGAP